MTTPKKEPWNERIDQRILAALEGQSVADVLFDRGILRSVYLYQHANDLSQRTVGFLNDHVFPDLLDRLEARLRRVEDRGFDTSLRTTQRLKDLAVELRGITMGGARAAGEDLAARLKALALSEADWQRATLQRTVPLTITFNGVNPGMLRAIVEERSVVGRVMKDWAEKLGRDTVDRVFQQINIGLAQGESVERISRRLRGTRANAFADGALSVTRHEAERIVRTAVSHISAQAREETYRANRDFIKGVRWLATLDLKTCLVCGKLDGTTYDIDTGPRPPVHWNCRCDTVGVPKTLRELGFDAPDMPEGMRAAFGGPVRESTTWSEWFLRQSVTDQKQILGPARFGLLKADKFALADFVSAKGHKLTLAQLDGLTRPDA